uniref:Uncharacterized protein n=1 Tax=Oryza brachyantha TaxID=4533 RepID=J3L125_ORYBR
MCVLLYCGDIIFIIISSIADVIWWVLVEQSGDVCVVSGTRVARGMDGGLNDGRGSERGWLVCCVK